MNAIFSFIMIISLGIMIFTSPDAVLPTMLSGAENAVGFTVKLFLIYTIWLSVLKIMEKTSIDKGIAKALSPVTKKLFKGESEDCYRYVNLNISANMLGMGGAATPMGIKAIETMKEKRNKTLLIVMNSTSLQLIPTTIISMRAAAGATTDIILPSLIVTVASTLFGIILTKIIVR